MVAFTANFRLIKPDFNSEGWDTQLNTDLDLLDSIIGQFNTGLTIQGVWLNATFYAAGVSVVDATTGHVWISSTTYTSSAAPITFAQDRVAFPTIWTDITNPATSAAASAANALISANNAAASLTTLQGLFGGGSTGTGMLVLSTGATITNPTFAGLGAITPTSVTTGAITATTISGTTGTFTGLISGSSTVGIKGTTTNDNAQAGSIGEFAECFLPGAATSTTVTVTIAAPCVLSWAAHPFVVNGNLPAAFAVEFTTTGALPTGLSVGVTYYATPINSSTLHLSTTAANALAGVFITTTGTQSGTHTGFACAFVTASTPTDVLAMTLTAGDWEVWGSANPTNAGTNTLFEVWTNSVSATIPAAPYSGRLVQWIGSTTTPPVLAVGRARYLVSGPANVFLSILEGSTTSGSCGGYMCARRMR